MWVSHDATAKTNSVCVNVNKCPRRVFDVLYVHIYSLLALERGFFQKDCALDWIGPLLHTLGVLDEDRKNTHHRYQD